MRKELSDMTLEELWQLFPITLEEHNPNWLIWYKEEEARLLSLFGSAIKQIDHIGSTYIPGLLAKPIVDILMQISPAADEKQIKAKLIGDGWLLMAEDAAGNSFDYNKGYTPDGFAEKVFHLHIRQTSAHDEILFRNYIAAHPEEAVEYAALKRRLMAKYKHNRDAYTEGKGDFIRKILRSAQYDNRGGLNDQNSLL